MSSLHAALRHTFGVICLCTLPAVQAQTDHPLAQPSAARATPAEGAGLPAQHVRDGRFGFAFDVPASWVLSRRDGDLSTFALDARTSLPRTRMRAVAQLGFNPIPYASFSGAYFYASVTPHLTEAECRGQASAPAPRTVTQANVGGVSFAHGYDEHGGMCIEERDEVYTAVRSGACYRFDLVINSFCGGGASGTRDMTPGELEGVRSRLEQILFTLRFDSK